LLLEGTKGNVGQAVESNAIAQPEDVLEALQENLRQRTNRLEPLAAKQQELMGKLLDTMEVWPLNNEGEQANEPGVYLMRKDKNGELRCEAWLGVESGALQFDRTHEGKTLEELKQVVGDTAAVAMEMHDEIRDYPVYLTFLYDKLAKQKEGLNL
jgi:hypothetical protein